MTDWDQWSCPVCGLHYSVKVLAEACTDRHFRELEES